MSDRLLLAVSGLETVNVDEAIVTAVPVTVDASEIAPVDVKLTAPLEVTGEFTAKEPLDVESDDTDMAALICAEPVKFSEAAPEVIGPLVLLNVVPDAVNEPAVRLIGAAMVIAPSDVEPAMSGEWDPRVRFRLTGEPGLLSEIAALMVRFPAAFIARD